MKTRQEKALKIKDFVTIINALSAELKEDGYKVVFIGGKFGRITDVKITKTTIL